MTLKTKNNKRIFWIDKFSILSFCSILNISIKNQSEIVYHSSSKVFLFFFNAINILFFRNFKVRKISYSLGDMRSANGESLRYEVAELSAGMAKKIAELIPRTEIYRKLENALPSKRLILYFEKKIVNQIYPIIRTACIINYYKRNGDNCTHAILWPQSGILLSLQTLWMGETISLLTYRGVIDKTQIKSLIKTILISMESFIYRLIYRDYIEKKENDSTTTIGIHCYEGIDLTRRNEIFWLPASNISPKKILIYFDRTSYLISSAYKTFITKEILDEIGTMGMRWVFLERNPFLRSKPIWVPQKSLPGLVAKLRQKHNLMIYKKDLPLEQWVFKTSKELLYRFSYWKSFYKAFNIKIDIDIEEAGYNPVCKAITLDVLGGALVGYQRSELFGPKGLFFGDFPHHIFFPWNKRGIENLMENDNKNNSYVISGYCYDYAFKEHIKECKLLRRKLNNMGVNFIIALFDNIFGAHSHFSKKIIESFYKSFLNWMLQDKSIGLILKPKKHWFIRKNLPEIENIIKQAQSTGRCIVLPDSQGSFPSRASKISDIAVGIGISSALIESVLTGTRGILCDLTHHRSHFFYKAGHNKIIFDSIELLIESLKQYKQNIKDKNNLGDFSLWNDLLDPFRDGKANSRIANHIELLLNGFERGNNRGAIISNSNKHYKSVWGDNKVVEIQDYD